MSWTRNSLTDELTHDTTARECAIVSDATMSTAFDFSIQTRRDDFIKIVFLSTQDGRSCWELGVLDATNIVIRRVDFGVPASSGSLGSYPVQTDTGTKVAHGLASNTPITLKARWVDSQLELYLNGNKILSFDNHTLQTYVRNAYFGVASDGDGAKCSGLAFGPLVPIIDPSREGLLALGGQELWESLDGGVTISRVGRVLIDPNAEVSIEEFGGLVYIVGNNRAYVYDATAPNADHQSKLFEWVPTAGTLPGQAQGADNKPGRTTATMLRRHINRVYFAGMPEDIQNAYATRTGDPNDLDTSDPVTGYAFAFNAQRAGKIGAPIRGLFSQEPALLIGCDFTIWALVGDPVFDTASVENVTKEAGVSGPRSMCEGPSKTVYAHTPRGLFVITGVAGSNASGLVLTQYLNLDDAERDTYSVHLQRDPAGQALFIFLTKKATAADPSPESVHLVFDERAAAIKQGGGGYFVDTYPASIGPVSSCVFNGKIVMGTRTGYLVVFDKNAKSDFDTASADLKAAIASKAPLSIMAHPNLVRETIMHGATILMGDDSDAVKWRVWEGVTAQEVYEGAGRAMRSRGSIAGRRTRITQGARGAAVVIEIYNDEKDKTWSFEQLDVVVTEGGLLSRASRTAKVAPGPPCAPHGASSGGSPGGSGSGFASGAGAGGSGFGGSVGGSGSGIFSGRGSLVHVPGSQAADAGISGIDAIVTD